MGHHLQSHGRGLSQHHQGHGGVSGQHHECYGGRSVMTVTEDFEWGADGDNIDTSGGDITWSQSTPGTCLAQIDTAQAHGGTRSLGIYRDGTNWPSAYFSLTCFPSRLAVIFVLRHTTGTAWVFYHGNGVKRIRIGCSPAATNYYYYYNAAGVYTSLGVPHANDTWATITLANIDFTAGTFDFYADGAKLATCTMETSASSANACSYGPNTGTGVTGWCWIDDIVLTYLPGFPYEFPIEFDLVDGIYCYIDWDGDGDFSAGFEDVSDYLRSFAITRGKDANMGRAMVGTADIVLKDVAGTYIPSTGYLDDIQNDYADTVREAYFNCTDGSERLPSIERTVTNASVYGLGGDSDFWIYRALTHAGITDQNLDDGDYAYPYVFPYRISDKTVITNFEDAEDGLFYIARAGTATWETQDHRSTFHSTSAWTCPGTVWRSLKTQNNWKNIINRVVMKVVPKYLSPSTAAVLWECPENATTNSAPLIEATCSRSWWADLKDINGNQNGAASYNTVSGTYFITNTSSLGGGVDRSAHCTIGWTGFCDSAYVTVTSSSDDVYLIRCALVGQIYTNGDEVRITSESTSSQDTYGLKVKALDLAWAPSSSDMQTIADNIVANNSSSRPSYVVELVPNSSDALQHALDLDISDRFTLQDSRISLSRDVYIDKVQHKWSVMDGVHHTLWTVSCAT